MHWRERVLVFLVLTAVVPALKIQNSFHVIRTGTSPTETLPPGRFKAASLNTWMGVASHVKCDTARVIDRLTKPCFLWFPNEQGDLYGQYCDATNVGYDLLPEIANGDSDFYGFFFSRRAFSLKSDINLADVLHVSDCIEWPQNTQAGRSIQRVGPFSSTGGYDAWLSSWGNSESFESVLNKYADGVFIKSFTFGLVDSSGNPLGLPPLHIHHQHGGSFPFGYRRAWSFAGLPQMVNAADFQCMSELGGVSCLRRTFPSGYGIFEKKPLNAEAYINDVRPIGSKPLEWWIAREIEWTPQTPSRIKSLSNMMLTRRYDLTIPGCSAFMVPTDSTSFWWYTVNMPRNMHAVLMSGHAHVAMLDQAYLFAATPEQLGLHNLPQSPNHWDPISLHQTGFNSVQGMMQYVLQHLANQTTTPRIVCHYIGIEESVDGFLYDRSPPAGTECLEWDFKAGDMVTSLGFSHPLNPRSTGYALVRNRSAIPPQYGMHQAWSIFYTSDDNDAYFEAFTGNGTLS